jgi:Ca2+-binding EF-hand superfamily protein
MHQRLHPVSTNQSGSGAATETTVLLIVRSFRAEVPMVRFRTVSLVLLVFVLIGSAGCASKQKQRYDDTSFIASDSNGDGKVTLEEFYADIARRDFQKTDRNSDGVISHEEWQRRSEAPGATAQFETMDENKDKRVTFLEFLSVVKNRSNAGQVFSTQDRNRDGVITSQDEPMDRKSLHAITFRF